MCPVTDNPTSCKIRANIHSLHAKTMNAAEIHCKLCTTVYSKNVMREKTVRQWHRMFTMKSKAISHLW
jgi:hypothetical protein